MSDLNRAIVLYIGWNIMSYPQEDELRVLDHFGKVKADNLVAEVRSCIGELRQIQPDWEKYDISSASKWAVGKLRSRHWTLNGNAKAALEWLYSWWWK